MISVMTPLCLASSSLLVNPKPPSSCASGCRMACSVAIVKIASNLGAVESVVIFSIVGPSLGLGGKSQEIMQCEALIAAKAIISQLVREEMFGKLEAEHKMEEDAYLDGVMKLIFLIYRLCSGRGALDRRCSRFFLLCVSFRPV